jgi:hypothetical protein
MNKSQQLILLSFMMVSLLFGQRMEKWEAESRDVGAYEEAIVKAKELVKLEAEKKFDEYIRNLESIKKPFRLNMPISLVVKNNNGSFKKVDGIFREVKRGRSVRVGDDWFQIDRFDKVTQLRLKNANNPSALSKIVQKDIDEQKVLKERWIEREVRVKLEKQFHYPEEFKRNVNVLNKTISKQKDSVFLVLTFVTQMTFCSYIKTSYLSLMYFKYILCDSNYTSSSHAYMLEYMCTGTSV